MEYKLRTQLLYMLILLFYAAGCQQVKKIVTRSSPRKEFTEALKNSPLKEKAFVRGWKSAWQQAVDQPVDISLPYQEKGLIFAADQHANAFHFVGRRGENLILQITSPVNIFAEIYSKNDLEKPLVWLKKGENRLEMEIEVSGSYIVAIQPELLANGNYTLTITNEASVAFPVSGSDSHAIQSFWGAMRDGGKRQHEGVDIFAPKGTPVLAVAPGTVRASTNRLGGKVVWHRTDKGQNFYYAHLDSQTVTRQRVKAGDTLGFVGNTGNARYTPPHLHFGIYLSGRGAVDPFPYIDNVRPAVPVVRADTIWESRLARISGKAANFRSTPSTSSQPDTILRQNTVVALKSATSDWYRVTLPDGKGGFVHASLVDTLQPVQALLPDSNYVAYLNPWSDHRDSLNLTNRPQVYGQFGQHLLIKHGSGNYLWLKR